jgi:hypothetical protein
MPDAIITSTASTFGTITGTFAADQSTITGTVSGIVPGTLSGSVGVPGPAGSPGTPGVGVPAGGTAGQYLQKTTTGVDYATDWVTLNLSGYALLSGADFTGRVTVPGSTGDEFARVPGFNIVPTQTEPTDKVDGDLWVYDDEGDTPSKFRVFLAGSTYNVATESWVSSLYAPIVSPVFTGNPRAPTPESGDNDTSIATTAFVKVQGYLTSAPVTSVAGRTGAITLSNTDISGLGSLAVVNDAPSNGSQYARKNAAWDVVIPGDRYLTSSTTSNTVSNGNKTFTIGTGLSYTPTQNITISYDASNHMHGEVLTYNSGTGVLTVDINHHTGSGTYAAWVVNVGGVTPATSVAWGAITGTLSTQTDLQNALDLKANLASPTFTGTPSLPTGTTAVTQTAGNNTTAVATTAFVQQEVPAASTTAAGKVELATFLEATRYTSSTLATTPKSLLGLIASTSGALRPRGSAFTAANSGTGASVTNYYGASVINGPNPSVNGYAGVWFDGGGQWCSNNVYTTPDWSKVSGFSVTVYRPNITFSSGNTIRITLGKAASGGTLSTRGIGVDIAAANTYAKILAHNGTTLTTTDSTFLISDYANLSTRNITMVSYGDGTVELFVNGVSYGTSSGGPTTAGGSGQRYSEEIYGNGTQGTQMQLWTFNASLFTGL